MQVHGEPKEKFVLRVENSYKGNQFIKQLKKSLNKNTYDIRVRYSGKRPKGTNQVSTRKENATSMRVYINSEVDRDALLETQSKYYRLLSEHRNLKDSLARLV